MLKSFDLTGRVALVTGGSKGLGKAMARGLVEAGADIVISSRTEPELKSALTDVLAGSDRKGKYLVADMTRRDQVAELARAAIDFLGRIDILVNNAGINRPQAIDAIQDADWDAVMETNLHSVMALTRAIVPQMMERRWGRVIHISSAFGFISKEKRNAYSASKAALLGLTRASCQDLGPFGITVNCIVPGPFLTDMPKNLLTPAEKQAFADHTALGRWAEPEEIIGPVLLLASEAGGYMTGSSLMVDGGTLAR